MLRGSLDRIQRFEPTAFAAQAGEIVIAFCEIADSLSALGNPAGADTIVGALHRFVEHHLENLPASASTVRTLNELANQCHHNGDFDKAIDYWERARDACLHWTHSHQDPEMLDWLSVLLNTLGQAYSTTGRFSEAYAAFCSRVNVLHELAEIIPDSPELSRNAALTEKRLFEVCRAQQQDSESLQHLDAYRNHFLAAAEANPHDARCQLDAAMVGLAMIESCGADSWSQCEEAAHRILRLLPDLPEDRLLWNDAAGGLISFAQVALNFEQQEKAQEYLDSANQLRQRLGQPPLCFEYPDQSG
jgi:tetratricopeptide (TPR) repeat protein